MNIIDYSQYKITDTAFHSRSSRDRLIKLDETLSLSLMACNNQWQRIALEAIC